MKTILQKGTTVENNSWLLPDGILTMDTEKKAVRIHDGITQGGFECIGAQAYEPKPPGPTELLGGDDQWGFYGEVASTDLITGDALALAIGLSSGTSQNSDVAWLKFNSNGRVVFVPKKTFRHSLTWAQIYGTGAIYGTPDSYGVSPVGTPRLQDAVVSIDGLDYRIRLFSGMNADPVVEASGYDIPSSHGSEWNRLMYRIQDDSTAKDPNHTTASEPADRWALYHESELGVHSLYGDGAYSLCQETVEGTTYRIARGYGGVSRLNRYGRASLGTYIGWRPVLELIQ